MKTNVLTQDADPSDPYTEARFEDADRERRAWLDRICKRELEISRQARELAKKKGRLAGAMVITRRLTRTHTLKPGTLGVPRTYCGRILGPTRKAGGVEERDLAETPTCQTCRERLARAPAGG